MRGRARIHVVIVRRQMERALCEKREVLRWLHPCLCAAYSLFCCDLCAPTPSIRSENRHKTELELNSNPSVLARNASRRGRTAEVPVSHQGVAPLMRRRPRLKVETHDDVPLDTCGPLRSRSLSEVLLECVDWWWEALATRLWLAALLYACSAPLMELAFYLNVRRFIRVRSLEPHRTRSSDTDYAEVYAFWMHLLTEESADRIDDMIRGWFINPEHEHAQSKLNPLLSSPKKRGCSEPRVGNVLQLIAWTLFNHDLASLSLEELQEAETVVRKIEAVRGAAYPPGTDPRLVCMRHTLGELEIVWKPLCFYLAALAAQRLAEAALYLRGFRRLSAQRLEYWHLPASTRGAQRRGRGDVHDAEPFVLMHGVGGLTPYIPFSFIVASEYPNPVLLPCFPSCTIRLPTLVSPPPAPTSELVASIEAMVAAHAALPPLSGMGPSHAGPRRDLDMGSEASAASSHAAGATGCSPRHRYADAEGERTLLRAEGGARATFVAHSMGTAFLAAVLRARPGLASGVLMVDPVCFLLYRRDVLYNFLYRKPALRRSWYRPSKWFNLALHRLLTREPCMQCCFRRDFWWSQYLLHPWDIPCDAAVLLSGHDAIVNAKEVERYLIEQAAALRRDPAADAACAAYEIRVEMHEGRSHGWLMVMPRIRRGVLDALAELPRRRGGES